MSYVDGFVAAVPKDKKDEYIRHCEITAPILKEYGVLQQVECWGDDVPEGKVTSFPMAVKAREDEIVVLGWLVWPSKEARDAGMAKVMEDPRMQPDQIPMPFDGMRLIYGGFDVLLEH